jgi:hypothetical protein
MCIRIVGLDSDKKYDSNKPLEEQIAGSQEVIINYDPKDKDIDCFISEMERMCSQGISANIKVDVNHADVLNGMRAKKQVQRLHKDLDLNEAIKCLTNLQSKTDKVLTELSNFCRNNER